MIPSRYPVNDEVEPAPAMLPLSAVVTAVPTVRGRLVPAPIPVVVIPSV